MFGKIVKNIQKFLTFGLSLALVFGLFASNITLTQAAGDWHFVDPSAGEEIGGGIWYNVTWDGSINLSGDMARDDVELAYQTQNGGAWTTIHIFEHWWDMGDSYWWTSVPNDNFDYARLKAVFNYHSIIDGSQYSETYYSGVFSIVYTGEPRFVNPSAGEIVPGDTTYVVTWEGYLNLSGNNTRDDVELAYQTQNGGAWTTIHTWNWFDLPTSYPWLVPNDPTDYARLKLVYNWHNTGTGAPGSWTAYSDVFSIVGPPTPTPPSMTFIHPSAGEFVPACSAYEIMWSYENGGFDLIDLSYQIIGGLGGGIATGIPGGGGGSGTGLGTYTWATPCDQAGGNATITATGYSFAGFPQGSATSEVFQLGGLSGPYFTFNSPTAGEQLDGGTSYNIRWDASTWYNTVDLAYQTANGGPWTTFASGLNISNGTYPWSVPEIATNYARIRAYAHGTIPPGFPLDDYYYSGVFSIKYPPVVVPAVHVFSPNGGEWLVIGTLTKIGWETKGIAGHEWMKIEIGYGSKNNDKIRWKTVGYSRNEGVFVWNVRGPETRLAWARVTALSSGASDTSDEPFSIVKFGR